jgi:hypothetical protein
MPGWIKTSYNSIGATNVPYTVEEDGNGCSCRRVASIDKGK